MVLKTNIRATFVTCTEKRDHSGFFMKIIEFLAWMDIIQSVDSISRDGPDITYNM